MDLFTQLFGGLLAFVYHCFDRIVIYGYLSGLSRPERVVNFFHQVVGVPVVSREILSQRTTDYQNWVEAFARNHRIPIEWAEKGVRKENHVLPGQRSMERDGSRYAYRLSPKGVQVALLFLFFHKRLCGPLASSRFHHRPIARHQPQSKLEAAYHRADKAIQQIVDLLPPDLGSDNCQNSLCQRLAQVEF